MTISINWFSRVISVPKADMTLVQTAPYEVRELNLNNFRLTLKDLEDDEAGMAYMRTHNHNSEISVGGVTLARVLEIINGYTVTFEDGQYAVNLAGANSNVSDVVNLNQVSVRAANSAGMVLVSSGSGLSTPQDERLSRIEKLLRNKQITDPTTGQITVYADDGVTPLLTADLFEDAAGSQAYRGQGAERRERLA